MNIRRLFNNSYLSWEEYKDLVYTMEFIDELSKARVSDIKRLGGDENGG